LKLLNKILLVFLVISFLTLYGGWRFIHSEKFSHDISARVSKILTEKAGAKLNFTGVEFSLIPLSTTFKNVTISKHDPKLFNLDLEAEDLEVTFAYSSFIASEPEIDEVSLRKGNVKLVINKKSEDDIILSELSTKEIFAKYVEILSAIPVRLNVIILENIDLSIDQSSVHVNKLSLAPQKRIMRLKADLENIVVKDEALGNEALTFSKARILANMERNEWKVEELFIQKDINTIDLDATLFNRGNKLIMNSKGGINANLENLFGSYKNIPEILKPMKGEIEARFDSNGVIDDPDANISFNAKSVVTPWIKLEKAGGIVSKRKNELLVQSLLANNGAELYQLKKAHSFYDLRKKEFTNFHFQLYVKEAYTNTFLYSLQDSLGTMKGYMTGEVDAFLFDDKAVFEIRQKMTMRDFKLTSSNGKSNILKNNLLNLEGTKITIHSDNSVDLDAKIKMPETVLKAVGRIDSKGVNINIKDSKINMNSFGPVAGLGISGSGPVKARISGPFDDIIFNFDVDWNNFSLVELNFGKVKSNFSLALKDLELTIHTMDGVFNKSVFNAVGTLGFEEGAGMDLQINFKTTNFSDAKKMYHLVFKNLKLPVNPEFNFSANYIVKGGYGVKDLKIDGQIKGTDLVVSNEEAEALTLRFTLDNNLLSFKQLKISKARGEIIANANINLNNNFIDLVGSSKGLRLRDFNFYRRLSLEYDGDVLLEFDGNGTTADFTSRLKTRVVNAFIENTPASSSNAIFYLNPNDVVINAVLFGGKAKVDSLISFKTNVAAIKSSVETDDIKELLGVFSGHNIAEKGITGRIKANLNTQISLSSLGVRRFFLDIEQLNLKKGDINLSINPRYNSIEVDEGFVKKWDLRFRDGSEFFESKGRNISNGVIAIDQRFAVKASLLEIVTDYIDRASGIIKGSNTIVLDKKITIKDFSLSGDNQSLKIKNLPGFVTDLNYTIVKKGETFEIARMNGKYGEGDFKVGGKVYFDDLYPQVNIDYRIDRARIPLFKRSSVLVSSVGTLTGTDLPYKLNGKVSFMHGEFLDDPADFTGDTKVSLDEYKKYLPEKDIFGKKGILELNVSFETVNPLAIKNNLAEVYIRGSGQASGNVTSPEFNARLEIIPNVSKFKFKGHDFMLNQGYVEIQDHGKNRVSDLKFTGLARISEYDMRLDLSGSITKVNIDLSSEPALSKEDLLSLLTLGVTSDMSKNLEASERKFVTTVGIGTLLVDQLKINEDLNSSLGVKLSVQPEFKEDETTLIQGKSAISDGSGSRLKSATKIKINKKVTNKVDVSLSSTVGGSLEQKQEMNVNYNINRNFSLEGVYEVKPSEDENTNTPNSLGADLKYRWSF
jgi:translocation and assembly module TamB